MSTARPIQFGVLDLGHTGDGVYTWVSPTAHEGAVRRVTLAPCSGSSLYLLMIMGAAHGACDVSLMWRVDSVDQAHESVLATLRAMNLAEWTSVLGLEACSVCRGAGERDLGDRYVDGFAPEAVVVECFECAGTGKEAA